VLALALANKLARIAWSVLARGRSFEVRSIATRSPRGSHDPSKISKRGICYLPVLFVQAAGRLDQAEELGRNGLKLWIEAAQPPSWRANAWISPDGFSIRSSGASRRPDPLRWPIRADRISQLR